MTGAGCWVGESGGDAASPLGRALRCTTGSVRQKCRRGQSRDTAEVKPGEVLSILHQALVMFPARILFMGHLLDSLEEEIIDRSLPK